MSSVKSDASRMKEAECRELYASADAAGKAAADACVPTPMVVVERANLFDDNSPVVKSYAPVMDGACGFAWVIVKPGTSSFARYLKKIGYTRDSYYGGINVWVRGYGQSYERKRAYAAAFAGVLRDAGINAYAMSRMG